MPENPDSSSRSARDPVPGVCTSCRFGSGPERDCSLIMAGELRELMDQGPCQVDRLMKSRVSIILKRRFPLAKDQADDIYQDSALKLLESGAAFPGKRLKGLVSLRRWLNRFLNNQVIDHLRRSKFITRLRCGSCEHFSRSNPQRCQLEFVNGDSGDLEPNPWWGDRVKPGTDPRQLDPPCREFEWRRPATYDIFDEELDRRSPAASKAEEAVRVCLLALDVLAESSERGMREAATISAYYLARRSVSEIAARSQVSEKTIKRLLASGRAELLKIMTRDFGVESPTELSA